MATLTALYTRLILDLNRDDMGSGGELEQAKIDAVADAIEFYADEQFWFNRTSGNKSTVANTATVAVPTGMRIATVISYLGSPLNKVSLEAIQGSQNVSSATTGPPSQWAEDEGAIRLYPTPDAVYTLGVFGIADLGVPSSGSSSNEWTTEAYHLILNEAKRILYAGPLRDAEGAQLADIEVTRYLTKLRRETRRRGAVPATTDLPVPTGYNILTG